LARIETTSHSETDLCLLCPSECGIRKNGHFSRTGTNRSRHFRWYLNRQPSLFKKLTELRSILKKRFVNPTRFRISVHASFVHNLQELAE